MPEPLTGMLGFGAIPNLGQIPHQMINKDASRRHLRTALTSGLSLGTGMAAFVHADAQTPSLLGWDMVRRERTWSPQDEDALSGMHGNDLLQRMHTPGCVINGSAADETILFGGAACDTAFGLAGNDIMYSYTGTTPDTLLADGGAGSDYLYTLGRGVAIMYGGLGEDEMEINAQKDAFLFGNEDADILRGYSYNEDLLIEGGLGDDVLKGYAYRGTVQIEGNEDQDEIHAIALEDNCTVDGGSGDDRIWAGSAEQRSWVIGGAGNDSLRSATLTGPQNLLEGGTGDDVLIVGINRPFAVDPVYLYGDAYLMGGEGNDLLLAHTGNDTLSGGSGADVLRAYAGDDLLIAEDALLSEADGGTGTDLLRTDFSFGLSDTLRLLRGLERMDVSGSAARTLQVPDGLGVHAATDGINALTGTPSTLVVEGGADDQVILGTSWSLTGTGSVGAATYKIYATPDSAILWIADGVNVTVQVTEAPPAWELQAGPNPTEGKFVLKCTVPDAGVANVVLQDLNGKRIFEQRWKVVQGFNQTEYDVSSLPEGAYLLEFTMRELRISQKLLVK